MQLTLSPSETPLVKTRFSLSSGYQLKIAPGLGMGYMFTSPLISRTLSGASFCILPRSELMHQSCCKPLTTIGLIFDSLCIFYSFTPFLYGCFSESSCFCFEQTSSKKQFRGRRAYSGSGDKTLNPGRKKTSRSHCVQTQGEERKQEVRILSASGWSLRSTSSNKAS